MPRFRLKYTEQKIKQLVRQGRGQGEGKDYLPWLQVGEFSSQGRSHRLYGIKTDRIHHFFSDLEQEYYYLLSWQDDVIDIREQYPLFPVSDTERIAEELGVKHPQNIGLGSSAVMSTDFLITTQRGTQTVLKARAVKYQKELDKLRTREKLAIERAYWEERGVEWRVVTEESFNRTTSKNIKRLEGCYFDPFKSICLSDEKLRYVYDLVLTLIEQPQESIRNICLLLDRKHNLIDGSFLSLFHHLTARKEILVQIEKPFRANTKVIDFINLDSLKNKLKEVNRYAANGK